LTPPPPCWKDIDYHYLQTWGHYRTLTELHGRIYGRIADPALNAGHLTNLGLCHNRLGEYRRAIDLLTQALVISRESGDREGEGAQLSNLGNCHDNLGEYQRAIDLQTQALAIVRDIANRYLEANALEYLARALLASGNAHQAVTLLGQGVSIADATGDIESAMEARSWLARAQLQLGDAAAALALTAVERELTYPPEEPTMHLLEGLALLTAIGCGSGW